MIRLYNTLTQQKETFEPLCPPQVGMYVCGPTVYSNSHIGHMVGPVIFDTIKRYLTFSGYRVTWVVNITDVDDKLIIAANETGTTVADLAAKVTKDYLDCLDALGVARGEAGIDHMPRATENIPEILAMTQGLIDRGFAYASGGDVYFDVTRAPEYGKLSHRDPDALQAGARIEPTERKRHPGDFALWKSSKPGEPSWDSPWGPGRPGWHIECSAMSMKLLGESFDIHGGGLDLVFPHHENEVAQSECHTGKVFAKYWLHNGLLTKDGKKISKSDPGTIVLMRDLLARHDPDTVRALLLSSHYRRPIDYGPGRLDELDRGLQAFRNLFERAERITGTSFDAMPAASHRDRPPGAETDDVRRHRDTFLDAMDDDFNTGGALGELFELVRTLNRQADAAKLDAAGSSAAELASFTAGLGVLRELTAILGLFQRPMARTKDEANDGGLTAPLLELLIDLRKQLRLEKNFKLADRIRADLTALGVALEDGPQGTRWKIGPR
jgi:cysteinyl-tRNA synthetase